MKHRMKIGTRGSKLALWQANWVKARIDELPFDITTEIVTIKTTGDRIVDRPLAAVGGKGLFVKEIEKALMDGDIDLAVHSMKDMPGRLPDPLTIGAVPVRENPFDVLISRDNSDLDRLPSGAKVGTSSLRRASQTKHIRPDLTVMSIRGNLDTRIRKLESGEFDAIIVAAAGVIRLGMTRHVTQYLDESAMVPAAGQGALCIETRKQDDTVKQVADRLNHDETRLCVSGERAFLKKIEGSCHIPVGCFGRTADDAIRLTGIVASEDGTEVVKETLTAQRNRVEQTGSDLAERLLEKGADKILENFTPNDRT